MEFKGEQRQRSGSMGYVVPETAELLQRVAEKHRKKVIISPVSQLPGRQGLVEIGTSSSANMSREWQVVERFRRIFGKK